MRAIPTWTAAIPATTSAMLRPEAVEAAEGGEADQGGDRHPSLEEPAGRDRPRRSEAPDDGVDTGGPVPFRVGEAVRQRQAGTARNGGRHEDRERERQAPGGPEPGIDGQQRDADREPDPRPARALEDEIVGRGRCRPRGPR